MKFEELIPFEQILEEELQDPEFRAEWERLAPARAVAIRLVRFRADHDLTQTALARKLGMSQPAIARLESGDHVPTLPTLLKLSETLGLEISVAMTPPGQHPATPSRNRHASRIEERVTTPGGASMTIAIQ
jgi:transcriptional regulator with XRE-family HTH domain